MAQKRIGVAVSAPDSSAALSSIENLEQRVFQRHGSRVLEPVVQMLSVSSLVPPSARST
jgi:hypothetical protein